jgi:hypothetical protein
MPWAPTIDEANKLTGKTLSESDLAQAQAIIETVVNVYEAQYPELYGRDGLVVKRAIAWQAAWMVERPDMFDRDDISGDPGSGVQGATMTWNMLAPLVRMSLKRLSWRGTRSTHVAVPTTFGDPEDDDIDRAGRPLPWSPL